MKKTLLFVTILFSVTLLTQGSLKKSNRKGTRPQNIVISETTYQQLMKRGRNHMKMARIVDEQNGIHPYKDDPLLRIGFEELMLRDPKTGRIPKDIRRQELAFVNNPATGLQNRLKASQMVWQQRGPFNVGGRTRALAIDIDNENIILAGGVTGGMWRSTDNGQTWTKTTSALDHQSVTAIAQDPREGQHNVWYYTTGEFIGSASATGAFYSGEGVFKSTDGGQSWNKLNVTDQDQTPIFTELFDVCWNICVNPINGNVFVATYGGIYRSKDQGNSWTLVLNSNPNNNSNWAPLTDIHCTTDGVKYATLSSGGDVRGIFRSTTGDVNSWTDITPDNFPASYRRIVVTTAPTNPNVAYFLAQTPDGGFQGHSLRKLTFNSAEDFTWEDRSNNLPERGEEDRDVDGYSSQSSYNMVIKVAPNNENVLFIGGTNLFRSDNAFATNTSTQWIGGYATQNDVNEYPNQHPDQHALVFKSDNKTLICGHDGGICITNDFSSSETDGTPVNWTKLNNGYYTTQCYTVAFDENTNSSNEIITGFQDNGSYATDKISSTESWIQVNSGDGGFASMHNTRNSFLSSSQRGVTYLNVYDETNDEWQFTRVDPEGAENPLFINPYIVDFNNESLMYFAGGQFVWRNKNIYDIPLFSNEPATQNWEKLDITQVVGQVSALETSSIPENILYYATSKGKIYKLENAHSDQAVKTDITGSNMPTDAYVSSIETDPLDANKILVSFSNYRVVSIYYSEDGGANWSAAAGNLEDNPDGSGNGPSVRWVNLVYTPDGPVYFAGTSTGLYSTSILQGGSTQWTQESDDGIGNTIVNMVKTRKDGLAVAGSHGGGVFSAKADFSSEQPIVQFAASQTVIPQGTSINFKDRSIGVTTNWSWSFEGAETTSSNLQNPGGITYNQEGTYSVSLEVGNANGTSSITKEAYITVTDEVVGIEAPLAKEEEAEFLIAPNPMEQQAEVKFANPNQSQYRLIVVDASGRVVRIIDNITGNNVFINREQLKPGLHIINLEGEKIYKGKLLVK